jgi:ribosomal protein L31E
MTQNWQAAEGEDREVPKKGKAVTIDHNLFDELWNMGNRKLPEEVMVRVEEEEEGGNKDQDT